MSDWISELKIDKGVCKTVPAKRVIKNYKTTCLNPFPLWTQIQFYSLLFLSFFVFLVLCLVFVVCLPFIVFLLVLFVLLVFIILLQLLVLLVLFFLFSLCCTCSLKHNLIPTNPPTPCPFSLCLTSQQNWSHHTICIFFFLITLGNLTINIKKKILVCQDNY